jgi:MFS superfamily sulfate permease-like transporter
VSNDARIVNLALTFASNNPEKSLYSCIIEKIVIIAKGNSKNVITQNKAITCLCNLTSIDANVVQDYLLWASKNLETIKDKGTIYTLLGLFQKVVTDCPSFYPPIMKCVYHYLDFQQGWVMITSLSLVCSFIHIHLNLIY